MHRISYTFNGKISKPRIIIALITSHTLQSYTPQRFHTVAQFCHQPTWNAHTFTHSYPWSLYTYTLQIQWIQHIRNISLLYVAFIHLPLSHHSSHFIPSHHSPTSFQPPYQTKSFQEEYITREKTNSLRTAIQPTIHTNHYPTTPQNYNKQQKRR